MNKPSQMEALELDGADVTDEGDLFVTMATTAHWRWLFNEDEARKLRDWLTEWLERRAK